MVVACDDLTALVRARCARWLAETGDPQTLRDLLATRFVQARLDALTLISDDLSRDGNIRTSA